MNNQGSAVGKYPNLRETILLSFGFFLVLYAFISASSVYSKLLRDNGHGDLGFYGLAILYGVFSISCIFAPSVASLVKD